MKKLLEHLEHFLDWGGIKKDIALFIISDVALILSLT